MNYLEEYAEVMFQLQCLEEDRQRLKELILADMETTNKMKVTTPRGMFVRTAYKTWTYSNLVTLLDKQLKTTKSREREQNVASSTYKWMLLFKPKLDSFESDRDPIGFSTMQIQDTNA